MQSFPVDNINVNQQYKIVIFHEQEIISKSIYITLTNLLGVFVPYSRQSMWFVFTLLMWKPACLEYVRGAGLITTNEVPLRVSSLLVTSLILCNTGKPAFLQYVRGCGLVTTNQRLSRVSPLVLTCLILGNTGKPACLNCTNQRLFILT
jgi:hypothetical protein